MTSFSVSYPAASFMFRWSAKDGRRMVSIDGAPARAAEAGQLSAPTVVIQYTNLKAGAQQPYAQRTGTGTGWVPPLRAVLAGVPRLGLLVIDGYAGLDPAGRPGLGAHAHAAFGVPVIGVAKTRFRTATHAVQILRGRPARPLFVTAAGMPLDQAASLIRRMAGPFRLPDALRRADALARTGHDHTTAARPETR